MNRPALMTLQDELDEMNRRAPELTRDDATRLLQMLNEVLASADRQVDQPLPPDWVPNESVREWARHMTPEVDYDIEFEKFTNYYLGEGVTRRSWDSAWRNWLIRSRSEYTRARRAQRAARDKRREDITRAATGGAGHDPLA